MKKTFKLSCLIVLVCVLSLQTSYAALYPLEIFTNNGTYYDDPGIDLYMEVSDGGSVANFEFFNNSTIDCTITRIFFDDGPILGSTFAINNGSGTDFSEVAPGPDRLPGGEDIGFDPDKEYNIGAEPAPPLNGLANGESLTIQINLVGATLQDVLDELDAGTLRVGLHVMAFPDGSSNSAVTVPEPATMCLLALGGLVLRKRKQE